MRAPRPRTAMISALFSAGVAATMLATATVHGPAPRPVPTAVLVPVADSGGGARTAAR